MFIVELNAKNTEHRQQKTNKHQKTKIFTFHFNNTLYMYCNNCTLSCFNKKNNTPWRTIFILIT